MKRLWEQRTKPFHNLIKRYLFALTGTSSNSHRPFPHSMVLTERGRQGQLKGKRQGTGMEREVSRVLTMVLGPKELSD